MANTPQARKRIRRALVTLVPQYNTWRMVQEYTTKYYLTK